MATTKALKMADLIDNNGDVQAANLDNVAAVSYTHLTLPTILLV